MAGSGFFTLKSTFLSYREVAVFGSGTMLSQTKLAIRIKILTAFSIVCLGIQASEVRAGIMLDGVSESQYVAFGSQPQFAGSGLAFTEVLDQQTQQIIRVSNGSGTLIAPNWAITAGHVGNPGFFQPGGTGPSYAVSRVIPHPQFVLNGSDINYGFDLALLQLSTSAPGGFANIYRGANEFNLGAAAITGFGVGGFGSDGGASGLPQARRAGTNVIDLPLDFDPIGPMGQMGAQNAAFMSDFDAPNGFGTPGQFNTFGVFGSSADPSPLEYHVANQDSGGGVYVFENGNWFLAGINSAVLSQQQAYTGFGIGGVGNTQPFGYGAIGIYTRVSSFQTFIDVNVLSVPEPGSFVLLSVIATGCVFSRRKKT